MSNFELSSFKYLLYPFYMKRLFFFLSCCFPFLSCHVKAENISRETAARIALHFFQTTPADGETATKSYQAPRFVWDSRSLSCQPFSTVSSLSVSAEAPAFYVFNRPDGNGFVLVAGEDRVRPILGYALDRTMPEAAEIPENMAVYLQSLHDEINQFRTMNTSVTALPTETQPDEYVGNEVVNLHTAEWAQFKPYNLKCPQDNGSYCATGCLATAFSIIMQHHRWPNHGEGVLPAYLSGNKAFPIAACDLSQRTYDWNQMLTHYAENSYTQVQADAVAQLMADVGHCFEVNYGLGSTEGYHSTNSFRKFLSSFRYDTGGERIDRDILLNDAEWIRRIKEDLDASRPIAYAATSSVNASQPNGRHIFVCDGYTDKDYFHFNWGWGGNGNGYFALSAMNPDANFNFITHHIGYFHISPVKPAATYTVTVSATEGGSARVDGRPMTTVQEGSTVKLTARAQYDYRFTHWTVNGQVVSEEATYQPVITGNTDFKAHFALKETGIGETRTDMLRYSVRSGLLCLEHLQGTARIYDLKGQLIRTVSSAESAEIVLPAGVYLLQTPDRSYKISLP